MIAVFALVSLLGAASPATPPQAWAPGIGAAIGSAVGELGGIALGFAIDAALGHNLCVGECSAQPGSASVDAAILAGFVGSVVAAAALGGVVGALLDGHDLLVVAAAGALGGAIASVAAVAGFFVFVAWLGSSRGDSGPLPSGLLPGLATGGALFAGGCLAAGVTTQLLVGAADE